MNLQVTGLTGVQIMLDELGDRADGIARQAIYEGAKLIADEYARALTALPTDDGGLRNGSKKLAIDSLQKEGLVDGFGISKVKNKNGRQYVYIGVAGYNRKRTKKYPKGQPNPMIARSLKKGTDYLEKDDFITPLLNRIKKQAQEAAEKVIINEVKKIAK